MTSHSKIALRYLKTSFLLDLTCIIPFFLFPLRLLNIISIIKLFSISRLKNFVRNLDLSIQLKLKIRLILLCLLLPLLYHMLACFWSFFDSDWIPPRFYINTALLSTRSSQISSYFEALYYNLLSGLASGDIGPVSLV